MDYSTYIKIATLFIDENYNGTNVLGKYNPSVEAKFHEYMLKQVLRELPNDPKKAIMLNNNFCSRFINSQRC